MFNKEFIAAAEKIFNPRNAFMISRNDGLFNNDYGHQRDTLINANTMINLARPNYREEEINKIERAKKSPKLVLPLINV